MTKKKEPKDSISELAMQRLLAKILLGEPDRWRCITLEVQWQYPRKKQDIISEVSGGIEFILKDEPYLFASRIEELQHEFKCEVGTYPIFSVTSVPNEFVRTQAWAFKLKDIRRVPSMEEEEEGYPRY